MIWMASGRASVQTAAGRWHGLLINRIPDWTCTCGWRCDGVYASKTWGTAESVVHRARIDSPSRIRAVQTNVVSASWCADLAADACLVRVRVEAIVQTRCRCRMGSG